jgi:hypothetical protein
VSEGGRREVAVGRDGRIGDGAKCDKARHLAYEICDGRYQREFAEDGVGFANKVRGENSRKQSNRSADFGEKEREREC